jgi:hypothetical protein
MKRPVKFNCVTLGVVGNWLHLNNSVIRLTLFRAILRQKDKTLGQELKIKLPDRQSSFLYDAQFYSTCVTANKVQ